jgi:hypothetical protein
MKIKAVQTSETLVPYHNNYVMSQPRRTQLVSSPLWKPQISYERHEIIICTGHKIYINKCLTRMENKLQMESGQHIAENNMILYADDEVLLHESED